MATTDRKPRVGPIQSLTAEIMRLVDDMAAAACPPGTEQAARCHREAEWLLGALVQAVRNEYEPT